MTYSTFQIWVIITLLGIGTFLIRFSFLGMIGNRQLPEWALRHLRYTAVAVLPAMSAPLVLWPAATEGVPDPARLAAAAATIAIGVITRHAIWAVLGGGATLYLMLWLVG